MRALGWLALATTVACSGGNNDGRKGKKSDKEPGTTEVIGMLDVERYDTTTNRNGVFEVEVDVSDDTTAFQITGISPDLYVAVEELYDPDGNRVLFWEDLWDAPRSLTDAIFGYGGTTAFNWPIRDEDGPLTPGVWRARMSMVDDRYNYADSAPVEVTVATKADDDFDSAVVSVQIVWADGIDSDPDSVAAVEAAVARWKEVWGAQGLTLDETYVSSTLDPRLEFVAESFGDDEVEQVARDKAPGALQLVVGEQIFNSGSTYGIAAGIPGTIEASGMSWTVISLVVHAGPDGVFDEPETNLMGETMAHEVGHYAGLYHPVEDGFENWDSLDDTVECTRARECEDELGTNLMFPYSICDANGCVVTEDLTPAQGGVMNRYLGAL